MKNKLTVSDILKGRGWKTIRLRPKQQCLMDAWEAILRDGQKPGEDYVTWKRRERQARLKANPVWGGRLKTRVASYALSRFFVIRAREDGLFRKLLPPFPAPAVQGEKVCPVFERGVW